VTRARAGSAFATDDDPVQSLEAAERVGAVERRIGEVDGPEQRLHRQEAHRGRRREQERDALVGALLVLDADTKPDVGERPACAALQGETASAYLLMPA